MLGYQDFLYEDIFARNILLWGEAGQQRLRDSRVLLAGLGGVGSYIAEALARAGIGELILVDFDRVSPSDINRQLPALLPNIGREKTKVVAERIAAINPYCCIETKEMIISPANVYQLGEADYFIDAIDDVGGKLAIINYVHRLGKPVASSMGAGRRVAPEQLRLGDISETKGCPLARIIRRELRFLGIKEGVTVVYSEEIARQNILDTKGEQEQEQEQGRGKGKKPLGSCSFVPAVAGLLLASAVVRDLAGLEP